VAIKIEKTKILKRLGILQIIFGFLVLIGAFLPISRSNFSLIGVKYNLTYSSLTGIEFAYNTIQFPIMSIFMVAILIAALGIIILGILELRKRLALAPSIINLLLGFITLLLPIFEFLFLKLTFSTLVSRNKALILLFEIIRRTNPSDPFLLGFEFGFYFANKFFENFYISAIPYVGFYMVIIPGIICLIIAIYMLLLEKRSKKPITPEERRENFQQKKKKIRELLLDLQSTKSRIKLSEIAEKCAVNEELVISTIKEMIKQEQIKAEYFASTKVIAFIQQDEMEEIDDLIETFQQWEEGGEGKKI
jgi:hypothetical protein